MAVALYYAWDRLGRPLEPANPIREIVQRLRVAYPRAAAANLFSWYANEAHYQAEPPQDHTPYSATGWPLVSPQWVVFATDVMHRTDLGVNCFELFNYWITEARAGRMPWLKYLIWQGRSYDVRSKWVPKDAVGHFDHIHISARTDHQFTSLGTWELIPQEDDVTPDEHRMLANEDRQLTADLNDQATVTQINGNLNFPNHNRNRLVELLTRTEQLGAKLDQILAALSGGATPTGPVDLTAAAVEDVAESVATQLSQRLTE